MRGTRAKALRRYAVRTMGAARLSRPPWAFRQWYRYLKRCYVRGVAP